MFPSLFGAVSQGGGAVPPVSWWVVAGKTCVAAYQPISAASLAASYTNLANPGTYDAAPGTAPTWASGTGWEFTGASSQYLTTGVVPASGWSVAVRYAGAGDVLAAVLGSQASSSTMFYIFPYRSGAVRYAYGNGSPNVAPGLAAGVLTMAGGAGYRDGIAENNAVGTWTGTGRAIILGAATATTGTVQWFFTGNVQAIAIYSDTLSGAEVATLSAAMAAL